jgi:hypothetical protein
VLSVGYLVVLGADHDAGVPFVLCLEAQGYIVIASVSTPEAVDLLEAKAKGYVRALVLDPNEVRTLFVCKVPYNGLL